MSEKPSLQFLDDVRAVVLDHYSGLPEDRADEAVWARLDAVLFDDERISRVFPDYDAAPLEDGATIVSGEPLELGIVRDSIHDPNFQMLGDPNEILAYISREEASQGVSAEPSA